MSEGNGKTVDEVAKRPMGLLRKRLREGELRVKQPGLPDCVFKLKAMSSDQFALMLDEASNMVRGLVPLGAVQHRVVKYSVVSIEGLCDEDGLPVDVQMQKYDILGARYVCMPDEILNMLPETVINLLNAEANEISTMGDYEKKDSNSTGDSETEGSIATPDQSNTAGNGSPAKTADSE